MFPVTYAPEADTYTMGDWLRNRMAFSRCDPNPSYIFIGMISDPTATGISPARVFVGTDPAKYGLS